MDNGKYNGSHKGTSHHTKNNNNGSIIHNKKEKGVVEKLLNSYGFLECASSGSRVFFHYSEYDGDPNDLNFGGKFPIVRRVIWWSASLLLPLTFSV